MLLDGAVIVKAYSGDHAAATLLLGTTDPSGLIGKALSLSHKDPARPCLSITEFVQARSDDEIAEWKGALGLGADMRAPFRGQTITVEDASPDSVLALIALVRRLSGQTLPEEWVDYARRWEQGYTDTTGAPRASFGALLSALTHPELQDPAGAPEAWRKAIVYTIGLLALEAHPADLPRVLPAAASSEARQIHDLAHARLSFEEIAYRRLMESASKLQLAVHIHGSRRRTLVDAVFFSEVTLTSTLKNFLHADASGFTGQGFALFGLFRPGHAGTGYDMTVSTDAAANLRLDALWRELERMEEARWAEFARTTDARSPSRCSRETPPIP